MGRAAIGIVASALLVCGCASAFEPICAGGCFEAAVQYECDRRLRDRVVGLTTIDSYDDLCVTRRDPSLRRMADAVASGRMALDRDALARCMALGLPIVFEDVFAVYSECPDIWVPLTPIGGACDSAFECIDGHCARTDYGRSRPDYVAGGCGVCVPRGGVGAPCDHHGWVGEELECEPGLVCDDVAPGATGTCMRPPGVGEPCASSSRVHCESGAYCDSSGVCRPNLAEGAYCTFADRCEGGSCLGYCSDGSECLGTCADGSTCMPHRCVRSRAVGERCDDAHPCDTGTCHLGVCSQGAAVGETCAGFYCAPGAVCDAAMICRGAVAHGAACVGAVQCPPDHACDGHCVLLRRLGETCGGADEHCVPGTECGSGICALLPTLGQPCTSACALGACVGGVCVSAPVGTMCDLGDPICGDDVCRTDNVCAAPPTSCMGWEACPLEQFCGEASLACAPICYVGR